MFKGLKVKQVIKFYLVILILILICFSSINCRQTTITNKNDENCNYLEIIENIYKPKKISESEIILHKKSWGEIVNNEEEIINFLIGFQFEDDEFIECRDKYYSLGYEDLRSTITKSLTPASIRVKSLYLISAIYYNDYYFASDRILYDNNTVQYDTLIGEYFKELPAASLNNILNNDVGLTNRAWETVIEWHNKYNGIPIKDLRLKGIRPFDNTSIYWYGEKGGKINSGYKSLIDIN